MRMFWVALSTAVLVGCSSGTEVEGVRVPGTIAGYFDDDPRVQVDRQGPMVSLTITTYGSGCHRKGKTEVEVAGSEVEVRPYDYAPLPGSPCTRDLVSFEHTATVSFLGSTADTAHVLVHGLSREHDPDGEPVTFEIDVPLE